MSEKKGPEEEAKGSSRRSLTAESGRSATCHRLSGQGVKRALQLNQALIKIIRKTPAAIIKTNVAIKLLATLKKRRGKNEREAEPSIDSGVGWYYRPCWWQNVSWQVASVNTSQNLTAECANPSYKPSLCNSTKEA